VKPSLDIKASRGEGTDNEQGFLSGMGESGLALMEEPGVQFEQY
jgi:hypothetical protein